MSCQCEYFGHFTYRKGKPVLDKRAKVHLCEYCKNGTTDEMGYSEKLSDIYVRGKHENNAVTHKDRLRIEFERLFLLEIDFVDVQPLVPSIIDEVYSENSKQLIDTFKSVHKEVIELLGLPQEFLSPLEQIMDTQETVYLDILDGD